MDLKNLFDGLANWKERTPCPACGRLTSLDSKKRLTTHKAAGGSALDKFERELRGEDVSDFVDYVDLPLCNAAGLTVEQAQEGSK
jgi:hypothetical protein